MSADEFAMVAVIVILVIIFIGGSIIENRQNEEFRENARKFFGDDWDA